MNWLEQHFGSFGYAVDVYVPTGDPKQHTRGDNSQDKTQYHDVPKQKNKNKSGGTISCDEHGNIERKFTYSEFLNYVDVKPVKNAVSHKPADSKYEDVLEFMLKKTKCIAPFDNIDMDDNEYIANELADHVKRGHLFDTQDAERIAKEWKWQNGDQEKQYWLSTHVGALGWGLFMASMQIIDWAYWRADAGWFGPKFNAEDRRAMNALKNLRAIWRGYRNSGTDFRFYGTKNFDEAITMARYGWRDKMDKIKKLETEIPQIYKTAPIPETKFSVAGNSVDIGRYLMGVPDCMRQTRRRFSEYADLTHKYVKIVVNISVSWTLSEDDIFNHGKNIASVINALESNNIHTKLILMNQVYQKKETEQKQPKTDIKDLKDLKDIFLPDFSPSDNVQSKDAPRYTIFITMKDYNDKFYLEKLMFPLAHRSFLRRLIFAAQERESKNIRQTFGFFDGCGYGIPCDRFDDSDENTLYFNASQYEQDKINEKLAKILKSHDNAFMQRVNTNKLER